MLHAANHDEALACHHILLTLIAHLKSKKESHQEPLPNGEGDLRSVSLTVNCRLFLFRGGASADVLTSNACKSMGAPMRIVEVTALPVLTVSRRALARQLLPYQLNVDVHYPSVDVVGSVTPVQLLWCS